MKRIYFEALLVLVLISSALLLSSCGLVKTPDALARPPEAAIAEAVQSYLAEQDSPFAQAEVKVEQLEGDFARVQIISTDPAQPGGFTGFMKRGDGVWMVLVAGSALNPMEIKALGIPESILPEGWVFSEPAGCSDATAGTLTWIDEERGYCLQYPASHTVIQLDSGNTEIVVGEVMNHIDPRISITSRDLTGRTLAQSVDDFLSGYEGFEIARSDITVDGQEAVLLDGIPGQDFYRALFVAYNDLLYQLNLAPYDTNLDNIDQAEQLYSLAMDSFHFTTP